VNVPDKRGEPRPTRGSMALRRSRHGIIGMRIWQGV